MTRFDAIDLARRTLTDEPVVVSLGHPAYELFAAGDRPLNFYTWGSMGLTSSIALGLALARPDRRVVALDGDGSLLMNLGSLATIAACAPANLLVLVLDNGQYGTTGGQATATAGAADLEAAARAMGVRQTATVRDAQAARARARGQPDDPGAVGDRGEGGRIGADGQAAARLRAHQAAVHGGAEPEADSRQ